MANFISVPSEAIEDKLRTCGFERAIQGEEVVYSRRHDKNCDVVVKVYTSIRMGRSAARDCGRDSIKVCTVFENGQKSFGIGKFPPVFRVTSVESVLERMHGRMREAYARGTEWIRKQSERNSDNFNQKWISYKNEFARIESEQEEVTFQSDPNFRAFRNRNSVRGGIDP